jgi:hypothetical protein
MSEAEMRAIARDAYVYGLPMVDTYRVTSVIHSETSLLSIVGRTQLFNPGDLDNVKAIQAGYKAQPLSVVALSSSEQAALKQGMLASFAQGAVRGLHALLLAKTRTSRRAVERAGDRARGVIVRGLVRAASAVHMSPGNCAALRTA